MKKTACINLFKTLAIAFLLCAFGMSTAAQPAVDCDHLLKQEINPDSLQRLISNTKTNCFGLDSIDVQLFGNGPLLGVILVKLASNNKGKITYADLLANINNSKKDSGYASVRKLIITQNSLEATIASPTTWEKSKGQLASIGTPPAEIETLHVLMLQNQDKNWNYRQLVVFYEFKEKASKTHRRTMVGDENAASIDSMKLTYAAYCDTGKLIKLGKSLLAFSDYAYGMQCAAKMHKTALVFFNAHFGVNCRGVESMITYDPDIYRYLQMNFVIINLMVDEREIAPNSSKSIGEINLDLEKTKFKRDNQPYFVLIDQIGHVIRSLDAIPDDKIFLKFLKSPTK